MKSITKKRPSKLFTCPECNMVYAEEKWAKKCRAWCLKYHTCNIEIIRHAVVQK